MVGSLHKLSDVLTLSQGCAKGTSPGVPPPPLSMLMLLSANLLLETIEKDLEIPQHRITMSSAECTLNIVCSVEVVEFAQPTNLAHMIFCLPCSLIVFCAKIMLELCFTKNFVNIFLLVILNMKYFYSPSIHICGSFHDQR